MSVSLPLFLSSGDLIADRRYDRAMELAGRGDLNAAGELLEQALEIAPAFASAWLALGELRARSGDRPGAIDAFRRLLAVDPEDRLGAALQLVRLGVSQAREPMSPAYLRTLFDQYAPRFDAALVAGLDYRAPQLLRAAVEAVRAPDARFNEMIDLGCGTGLAGEALRTLCGEMAGVDLSPAMIELARRKGIYARLAVADMGAWLGQQAPASADLVIAADTFVYVADLAAICAAAANVLRPGGLLAFTVESHAGAGVVLGEKLRFAHGEDHVGAAIAAAGLSLRALDRASTRNENAIPVPGLVVVAER